MSSTARSMLKLLVAAVLVPPGLWCLPSVPGSMSARQGGIVRSDKQPFRKTDAARPLPIDPDVEDLRRVEQTIARAPETDTTAVVEVVLRTNRAGQKGETISTGLRLLAGVVLLGMAVTFVGVWWTVISGLRGSEVFLRAVVGAANWCGLVVLAVGGFLFFLGEILLEFPSALVLTLLAGSVVASAALAAYAWRGREPTLRALSRWCGAWIAGCLVIFLWEIAGASRWSPGATSGRLLDTLMMSFTVFLVAIPMALVLHGQRMWAEGLRAAGWLAVLWGSFPLLLVTGLALAELADGLSNRLILYN